MSKQFRPWHPEQAYLFAPSPRDWLPENHLVYFLLDVVGQMDRSALLLPYQAQERGQPPFHPRMMVTLLLYGYATDTFSSRRLMSRCQTDVACRIIVGGDIPDFRTISDFRKLHLAALEGLFTQVLRLCATAGLVRRPPPRQGLGAVRGGHARRHPRFEPHPGELPLGPRRKALRPPGGAVTDFLVAVTELVSDPRQLNHLLPLE